MDCLVLTKNLVDYLFLTKYPIDTSTLVVVAMYTTKRSNSLEIQPFLVGLRKKKYPIDYLVLSKYLVDCLVLTWYGDVVLLSHILQWVGDVGRVDDDVPAAVFVVLGHHCDVAARQADLKDRTPVAYGTIASFWP